MIKISLWAWIIWFSTRNLISDPSSFINSAFKSFFSADSGRTKLMPICYMIKGIFFGYFLNPKLPYKFLSESPSQRQGANFYKQSNGHIPCGDSTLQWESFAKCYCLLISAKEKSRKYWYSSNVIDLLQEKLSDLYRADCWDRHKEV